MTRPIKFLFGRARLGTLAVVAATALALPQAQAELLTGPPLGCNCGNLEFSDSNVVGDVIIGDSGQFIGSGSGTITGTVQFSAANTGQYMPDGITVTGGAVFGVTSVQTTLNAINSLSQSLSGERGTALDISAGGSVSASSGMLDGSGNEVFTATVNSNFVPGTTFTISGTSSQTAVINIPATGTILFDGSIVLTGGITSDQVLFNFDSGDYETEINGALLTIVNQGSATTGTYVDPNGSITIADSVINGRVFGAPTDFAVIASTITAPVPEPTSLALLSAGVVAFGIIRRRRRSPIPRS